MNDIVCLDKRMEVHGTVSLEYVAKDGTVRHICSGNAAFNAAWNASFNIASFLRYSDGVLALTDYTGDVDKKFPIIPGNVVGYASVGGGTSGLYKGAEIISSREQTISDSGKITDKRVYEFTSSQVPGPIRTIGYTQQWNYGRAEGNNNGAGYRLPYMDPRKIYGNVISTTGISIDDTYRTVVGIYDFRYNSSTGTFTITFRKYAADNTYTAYPLTAQSSINTDMSLVQYIVVYDLDLGVYEIVADMFHYVSAESKYVVTRFFFTIDANLTTMTLTKTMRLTTGTSGGFSSAEYVKHYIYPYGSSQYISVYGFKNNGKYYVHSKEYDSSAARKGLYEADLEVAHNDGVTQRDLIRYIHPQIPHGGDDATTVVDSRYVRSALLLRDKIIAYTSSYNENSLCVYNLADLTVPYGTVRTKSVGGYSTHAFIIHDHRDDSEFLCMYKRDGQTLFNNYWFESCGALTWFRVPDDAPVRQEGDGIRITYEITITPIEEQQGTGGT